MLKAVLFDFDQTLVNSADGFRSAEHWVQRSLFDWLGLSSWDDFVALYRRLRTEVGGNSPAHKVRQWIQVCATHNAEPGDNELALWEKGYWERVDARTELLPETVPVLGELSETFRLGLLTNASTLEESEFHNERFRPLMALFGSVIVCGRNEVPLKPDPAGFRKVLSQLQTAPGEAVFVGDDWTDDVCGARGAGILPVWLRHAAIERSPVGKVPGDVVFIDGLRPLTRLCAGDSLDTVRWKLDRRFRTEKDTAPRGAFT